jgi:hypothetical protein
VPIRPLQLYADGGYQLRIRRLEGTPNYGPRQEVGPIWPVDAQGGQSTARWRASMAVGSPARLPGAIGEGKGCVVFVREW